MLEYLQNLSRDLIYWCFVSGDDDLILQLAPSSIPAMLMFNHSGTVRLPFPGKRSCERTLQPHGQDV